MAFVTDGTLGINLMETDTALGEFSLLTLKPANDGNWYQKVQANGAISQYAFVKVDIDGQAVELTTAISGSEPTAVGCAQIAAADNDYFWVARGGGTFTGETAAAIAVDVKIHTTATAGAVDDTGGDVIQGLVALAATGGAANTTFFSPTLMTTNSET